jgi:hypothetical protein
MGIPENNNNCILIKQENLEKLKNFETWKLWKHGYIDLEDPLFDEKLNELTTPLK